MKDSINEEEMIIRNQYDDEDDHNHSNEIKREK